jgi:AmmeMemoRadiSam system protein B/AmmeMemoRadiSam system protein A
MKRIKTEFHFVLTLIFMFGFTSGCSSQEGGSSATKTDRKPAAAGRFYPGDPAQLKSDMVDLFRTAKPKTLNNVVAIISPHAGYVFSGGVAASGFNQFDPDRKYDNVFVIASSHQVSFMGASIYNKGDYVTPLGSVPVNRELADELIGSNPVFTFNPEADKTEHSLEVQVPFLQYHLKQPFKLVPIVLGTQSEQTCMKVAQALKPYFGGNNLFVISTDFSHYPSYDDAKATDKATCDAILKGDPEGLVNFLDKYKTKKVGNLATNLCGWTSVLTLLYMISGDPSCSLQPVEYRNSGDSQYGDRQQVVGYWAIAVTKTGNTSQSSSFEFTLNEKETLLKIARNTVQAYVSTRRRPGIDTTGFTDNLKLHTGAFVTLKENGELRGCIGRFTADVPLYQVVQEMAIASSTEDTRFMPVTPAEVPKLEVEISVLSPMKRIYSADEIVLGKHGIYIKKGWSSGTFLPQVATETGWTKEEFLGHCSRDKAGIGWDGWKSAELYTYEALVFSEKEISGGKD